MWQYILKRLVAMFFTLIGITLVIMLIIHLAPGSPAQQKLSSGGIQQASAKGQLAAESIKQFKRQFNLDKPLFLNFRPFQNYEPLVEFYVRFLSSDLKTREKMVQKAVENRPGGNFKHLRFLGIPEFLETWKDPEQQDGLLKRRIKQEVHFKFPDHARMILPVLMELYEDEKQKLQKSNDISPPSNRLIVLLRLIRLNAQRPFPFTIRSTDVSRQTLDNIKFVWKHFWERKKNDFKSIPSDRRSKLEQSLNQLRKKDTKERVNVIRYQLTKQDIPFFVEQLLNASDPTTIAACSQVLIRKMEGEQPIHARIGENASRKEVETALAVWDRWWEQNQSRYRFSLPEKLGHMGYQTQYGLYISNLLHLEFGQTMSRPKEPVLDRIAKKAWRTGPLVFFSGILLYLFAIPVGIICAVYQRTFIDRGITLGLFLMYSIPSYVAALILLALLANPLLPETYWFPASGLPDFRGVFQLSPLRTEFYSYLGNYFYHAALPIFCLSVLPMASLAMYSRTSMLEVILKDYVRTARAKGLSGPIVILKHVARNGLNPLITLFANLFPRVVGGSLFIEVVFGIEGIGFMILNASNAKDYNLLMGILLITAVLTLIGILISDLLQVVADPRISFESAE